MNLVCNILSHCSRKRKTRLTGSYYRRKLSDWDC